MSSLYGNELQDCLVSSGRLIEALETLEDWLIRVEPDLAEVKVTSGPLPDYFRFTTGRLPVDFRFEKYFKLIDGDLDTVESLIEQHNQLKKEFKNHERSFMSLRGQANNLSTVDSAWIKPQIAGLTTRWEHLRNLANRRDEKLEQARKRAQEFQNRLNDNLKWLGGAEDQLEQISTWIDNSSENVDDAKDAFQNLKIDFAARQKEIDKTFEAGNKILSNSHSSSIPTIKHWLGALNAG